MPMVILGLLAPDYKPSDFKMLLPLLLHGHYIVRDEAWGLAYYWLRHGVDILDDVDSRIVDQFKEIAPKAYNNHLVKAAELREKGLLRE